jgi:hypothetical protein
MSSTNLIRLGGLAAIVAGILRGINSFLPSSNPNVTTSILSLRLAFTCYVSITYQYTDSFV